MRGLRTAVVLIAFLVACAFLISVALAVGVTAIAIYVGALLAAWTFAALVLPVSFGVISPDELLASLRARRAFATQHEGEALPGRRLGIVLRRKPARVIEDDAGTTLATAAPFAIHHMERHERQLVARQAANGIPER